eukprot:CAMPEP_0197824144 /NCGR_PEP_ID=MMETSP1437-20131217/1450_1 /TAXON_ID=49252 ORGANISM="Eucampia antarctica, Strain CCMP1452" /NCGR_SAMPLE_ID=MMETSP1437 /ASSEMBLY_ACC=CAM_ASM_001096 /LENGTH=203 /DNA_ID=CAMNT_0043423673 /DNA_START=36 /DNA_END=647 /DNA_ORIENTATION=-
MTSEAVKANFVKYTGFVAEDKSDKKTLKWATTKLNSTKKDGYTITCNQRPIEKCVLIETEVIFESKKVEDVVAVFGDSISYENDETLTEYKVVEKKGNSVVHYGRYKIPIPFVSDRDLVFEVTKEVITEGTFVSTCDVECSAHPVDKKVVRMTLWGGALFTQDGDNVKLVTYDYGDAQNKLLNGFDAAYSCTEIDSIIKLMNK